MHAPILSDTQKVGSGSSEPALSQGASALTLPSSISNIVHHGSENASLEQPCLTSQSSSLTNSSLDLVSMMQKTKSMPTDLEIPSTSKDTSQAKPLKSILKASKPVAELSSAENAENSDLQAVVVRAKQLAKSRLEWLIFRYTNIIKRQSSPLPEEVAACNIKILRANNELANYPPALKEAVDRMLTRSAKYLSSMDIICGLFSYLVQDVGHVLDRYGPYIPLDELQQYKSEYQYLKTALEKLSMLRMEMEKSQ